MWVREGAKSCLPVSASSAGANPCHPSRPTETALPVSVSTTRPLCPRLGGVTTHHAPALFRDPFHRLLPNSLVRISVSCGARSLNVNASIKCPSNER